MQLGPEATPSWSSMPNSVSGRHRNQKRTTPCKQSTHIVPQCWDVSFLPGLGPAFPWPHERSRHDHVSCRCFPGHLDSSQLEMGAPTTSRLQRQRRWSLGGHKAEVWNIGGQEPACGGSYGGNQEPHRLWHRHQLQFKQRCVYKKKYQPWSARLQVSLLPSAETPVRESTRAMPHVHMYTHVWSCTCMRAYISVQYLHVPYMQAYMICSALSNSGSLQWASSVEKWKVPADHLRCTSSKVQRQGQNQNVFHVGVRQPLPGSAEHLRTQSRLPARFSDSCLANFNQNPMVQTLLPLVRAWLWLPLVTSLTYRFQHVFACCTQALYHHRGICTTGNKPAQTNTHANHA